VREGIDGAGGLGVVDRVRSMKVNWRNPMGAWAAAGDVVDVVGGVVIVEP
jgi:hypothetical protein